MKWLTTRTTFGLVMIVGGILFLLQNMGVIPSAGWMWVAVFGAVGTYFLSIFLTRRDNWWAAFPGFGALGIAGTIAIQEFAALPDELSGAVFLGAGGLGFLAIYFRTREHWWPIIPAGAMLAVTGVVIVSGYQDLFAVNMIPVVLFGGMALTFLLVYITPSELGRARWAIWPAVALLGVTALTSVAVFDLARYVFPIVLIAVGAILLFRPKRRGAES